VFAKQRLSVLNTHVVVAHDSLTLDKKRSVARNLDRFSFGDRQNVELRQVERPVDNYKVPRKWIGPVLKRNQAQSALIMPFHGKPACKTMAIDNLGQFVFG